MADREREGSARSGRLPCIIGAQRSELCAALALTAVGLFFIWQALRLRLGDLSLPGPAFFPLLLALLLAAFATRIAVGLWREHASGDTIELGHRDVLIALAAMLAVPLVFEPLGAYLTLGMFTAVLLMAIGRVSLLRATLAAGVGMVACWLVFQVLLGVQLPRGPF